MKIAAMKAEFERHAAFDLLRGDELARLASYADRPLGWRRDWLPIVRRHLPCVFDLRAPAGGLPLQLGEYRIRVSGDDELQLLAVQLGSGSSRRLGVSHKPDRYRFNYVVRVESFTIAIIEGTIVDPGGT